MIEIHQQGVLFVVYLKFEIFLLHPYQLSSKVIIKKGRAKSYET